MIEIIYNDKEHIKINKKSSLKNCFDANHFYFNKKSTRNQFQMTLLSYIFFTFVNCIEKR